MSKKRRAAAAPELLRELESAAGEVRAIFALRKEFGPRAGASGVREIISDLLARTEKLTGASARDVLIYEGLGTFALQAPSEFIRRLIDQVEIKSAAPEGTHSGSLIAPEDVSDPLPGDGEKPRN